MTARQFRELLDYYNIEPFGEFRDELRTGKLMALTANINRDPKTRPEPFAALDYMDYVEKESEKIYSQKELDAYADKVFCAPKGSTCLTVLK
ncbi:DUF4035 domain-containing protein [Candidatus Pacearchaeota archaeon]|nr:DUF4035 domain-containing protein [Candidatus Pacearchaeota archaeon]